MNKKKPHKILVVEYDVTTLSKKQIGELELEAVVQGEASDGEGGKRYDGTTGHPDTPVLGSKVSKRGARTLLVVEYDIEHLTKDQAGWLASEAEVQAERSDGHPTVSVTSRIVEHGRKSP